MLNIKQTFRAALACSVFGTASAGAGEAQSPNVEIVTSVGSITIELWPQQAPQTVANFLTLVDDGFYEGLVFHRVIAGFMIQAGGYDAAMNHRSPPRTVVNESTNGQRNLRWTIAMARHSDPDSADSQFFINVVDNPHLDAQAEQPGYTVFGRVISGQEVAERIELTDTDTVAGKANVPVTPIAILAARRLAGSADADTDA